MNAWILSSLKIYMLVFACMYQILTDKSRRRVALLSVFQSSRRKGMGLQLWCKEFPRILFFCALMLLKIPLSFSCHSLQKQYPFIPYRIHTQFFLQSAQSLLLAKIKFKISTWLPEKVAVLNVRQFIPADGLLSSLTLLFSFVSKQLLEAAVCPYHLDKKIHLFLRDLFGNTGFIKTVILRLHLEELNIPLAFSTDQNAFVSYGLNGGKRWEVCIFRTALQERTAEEEKMGIKKICSSPVVGTDSWQKNKGRLHLGGVETLFLIHVERHSIVQFSCHACALFCLQ